MSSLMATGDGFTPEEVAATLSTPSLDWTPTLDYDEADLGDLYSGPRYLMLVGRVANLYNGPKPSKRPKAAQGCIKIMMADDTGALTVRLWYANAQYKLRLGQLITVWTVHISHGGQSSLAPSTAPLFTSIFPEGERNCYVMVHENSDDGTICKRPFKCIGMQALPGLMTLKNFTNGGYDVDNCKLLVCVKSIGTRKEFTNKNGSTSELITVMLFDDTIDASLVLYGDVCTSASFWEPSHTILLISNPGWRFDRAPKLSLNANTRVDIDPDMAGARWLRAAAQRLEKRDHVNPPYPEGVFDGETAENAPVRVLYTLADIDEFARANPKEKFMGYISVLITELNIVTNFRRNMLMCTEHCGIPLFANRVTAKCKQCGRFVLLRINPQVLGPIIDETGQISSGKLVLSSAAWEQLLGRTAEQLVATGLDKLQYLEQRLIFLRVTMGFGMRLEAEVGRLAVWCVKM